MKIFKAEKIKRGLNYFVFLMENQKFSKEFDLNGDEKIVEKSIEKIKFSGKDGEFKIAHIEEFKSNFLFYGLGDKITNEHLKNILASNLLKFEDEIHIFINPKILRIKDGFSFPLTIFNISTVDYSFVEFSGEKFKEKNAYIFKPKKVKEKEFNEILNKIEGLKEGNFLAREIGNYPSSFFKMQNLLGILKNYEKEFGWKINLYDEGKLKALKLEGILNVGKGSENPPYLLEIKTGPTTEIALIGKGVVFDSGGLSIKTAEGMENMKYDKCGAGVVLGTILALSKLKKIKNVTAYLPIVENIPSHKSLRPGDIIKYSNEKTVEVLTTDAEGRLILADCIIMASKEKPKAIITIATLTGAMKYSLGPYAAGLFTKDKIMEKKLMESSFRTGEFLWPFPMWEEYEELIKGEHTTLKNSSKGAAGSIAGAVFLNHFTDLPFAHVDIAQVAYREEKKQKGATGFGVYLLTDLIINGFN